MVRAETIVLASGAALVLFACSVPYGTAPAEGQTAVPSAVVETASPSANAPADGEASTASGASDAAAPTAVPASPDASPPAAPPACAARSFPEGEYQGVCKDQGAVLGLQRAALARGSCETGLLCVPCTVLGKPTGVAGCPSVP